MIAEGNPAPDLELRTDDGRSLHLSELRGRPVVLYFYPKDDTPGCTAEACAIRDAWGDFRSRGAEVFGVSTQDAESHRAFRDKHQLPFPLLVDEGQELAHAFDVEAYDRNGETYYNRSTVVIDEDGRIAKVMENVDPITHADEVLAAIGAVAG
jgi:peroxiredoxin Q/BCP